MFELLPLSYRYDALEPYIDAETVEIHHDKHHAAYTLNLNNAIKGTPLAGKSEGEIYKEVGNYPAVLRNNFGGYVNHNLYWQILAKAGTAPKPTGLLAQAIDRDFGSFDAFKEKFTAEAMSRFASGWAWLTVNTNGDLEVISTPNQDNPRMNIWQAAKGYPILTIDVWEHAYYLKYRNRRAEYVENFYTVINWAAVEGLYAEALDNNEKHGSECKRGTCSH